jgi:hypothetical protein
MLKLPLFDQQLFGQNRNQNRQGDLSPSSNQNSRNARLFNKIASLALNGSMARTDARHYFPMVDAVADGPMGVVTSQTQTAESCDYSGMWFDPLRPGEGYNVFASSSGWVIYFLGFDNWGTNFWVTSEFVNPGNVEFGEPVSLTMFIMPMQIGADFRHPLPPSSLEPWGTLEVAFDSCVSGVFTLDAIDSWDFGFKVSHAINLMGALADAGS